MALIAHDVVEDVVRAGGRFIDQAETNAELAAFLAVRCGKLTASRMKDATAFNKDGKPSQKRSDLMRDLLAERITGLSTRHFVNPAMQWGLDHEQEAKEYFTKVTGTVLIPSGFYDSPHIDMFGATPDSEIGNDGLAEIKCPTTATYIEWVMAGTVPDEHKPQMLAQLACTGRKYVIFVAFDPRIKDEGRRLFVREFRPAESEIIHIELQAQNFLNELEKMFQQFTEAA